MMDRRSGEPRKPHTASHRIPGSLKCRVSCLVLRRRVKRRKAKASPLFSHSVLDHEALNRNRSPSIKDGEAQIRVLTSELLLCCDQPLTHTLP